METIFYKLHQSGAKCNVDIGDGSERGEYVSQDYILSRLHRPHRAVSLMYCYYPLDESWPLRASEAHSGEVTFAWDYPYDDYFPYQGGLGTTLTEESEPFRSMRDIRRHGQDVSLTLTIDPRVSDNHIRRIAEELKSFGRLLLRLNHEATGNWFAFNKRCTYQEVADFFVRATNIFHEVAPQIRLILCAGGYDEKTGRIEMEDEFAEAFRCCDVWSIDKYPALHWGWPFDIAEPGGKSHARYDIQNIYDTAHKSFNLFKKLNGDAKPMTLAELNADGDVTGPYEQAEMVSELYELVEGSDEGWLSAITLYQFRDRGRLGLEIEDPSDSEVGHEQPLLSAYRSIIHRDYFLPKLTQGDETTLPIVLRWGGSEDAEGLRIPVELTSDPVFLEAYFDKSDENCYMLSINGRWFFRAPSVSSVDLMPAFFNDKVGTARSLSLDLFATPNGENDTTLPDGDINYYSTVNVLPTIRIRYTPTEK